MRVKEFTSGLAIQQAINPAGHKLYRVISVGLGYCKHTRENILSLPNYSLSNLLSAEVSEIPLYLKGT